MSSQTILTCTAIYVVAVFVIAIVTGALDCGRRLRNASEEEYGYDED